MTDTVSSPAWSRADERALRAVAIHFVVNGAVLASWLPRLPEIRDALDVSLATVGQAIMVAGIGGLLGSAIAHRFIALGGTRRVMVVGTVALVLALPGIALAPSLALLMVVLAVLAFLDVVIDIAMNMQGSVLSARRATPVMNRLHGMWSVGTVVSGSAAAAMAAQSVPLLWHLVGAAALMLCAVAWTAGQLLPRDEPAPPPDNAQGARASARPLWLFALLGGAALVPEMVATDWASFRLHDDLDVPLGPASIGFVAFTSGMVVARMLGDFVLVRWGATRTLNGACVLALFGCLLQSLVASPLVSCLGFALSGIGVSVLFPAIYDAAARRPGTPGAALGAMTAGTRASALATPFLVGSLADWNSDVGLTMVITILPALLVVWLCSR